MFLVFNKNKILTYLFAVVMVFSLIGFAKLLENKESVETTGVQNIIVEGNNVVNNKIVDNNVGKNVINSMNN